jgi:very-short-patch-repair endonuclease
MARNLTYPERLLWSKLRHVRGWYKQKVVLGYIADFWCPKAGLVIEVDGPHHVKQRTYDAHRDAVLKRHGIETMRFDVMTVENSLPAVVAIIEDRARQRLL